MNRIPDPRRYSCSDGSRLAGAAAQLAAASSASQHAFAVKVREEIARLLAGGAEHCVRAALNQPSSAAAGQALWTQIDKVLSPERIDVGAQLRVFAIPILIVAGGQAGAVIPGIIPAIEELRELFADSGAIGQSKNFGLSNVLASLDALEAMSWTALHRIAVGNTGELGTLPDLPPSEIRLLSSEESVYLRFLPGAAVTPMDAPGFAETAGDIGRWGLPFTRALAAQIGQSGVSLLPIARAPVSILGAARAGRFSANEIGFQLFLSNALRQARLRIGDPDVTVAAYSDASIRVRLTSAFDDSLDRAYRWPLTPIDDLDEILDSIFGLMAEVRLDRIETVETIVAVDGQE